MSTGASDTDRDRALAVLQRHTGTGRLTLDEFDDRVRRVCAAGTVEEIAGVLGDLQSGPDAELPRRDLLRVFGIAAVTLVLLMIFVALSRG